MYKIVLSKHFQSFEPFLINIQSYFSVNNESIHKARNELKIISYNDQKTVVKSFKRPNLLRSFIYTFLRDSKAKKSFDNCLRLKDFTPKPIGYIEFYQNSFLSTSYFVSEKFDYNFTIREPLLDNTFENRNEVFQEFAKFTFELHQANILHLDYSPGNILIKKQNNSYIFKVVDVNRMDFRELSLHERLQNFNKLWANDHDLTVMAQEYAKLINEDENKCVEIACEFNNKHKNKMRLKHRLKGKKIND